MYEGNLSMAALSPVIGYDGEKDLFFNDDKTIGFGFMCQPLAYTNDSLHDKLKTFLEMDFPEDTTISLMLYRSPDIDEFIDAMITQRHGFHDSLLSPMLLDRAKFLREHTDKPIIASRGGGVFDCGRIVDVKLIITVKLPVSDGIDPTPEKLTQAVDLQKQSLSALRECGFAPRAMRDFDFIRVMSTLVNWGPDASWKNSVYMADPFTPLNEQFFDHDTDLDDTDPSRSCIRLHQRQGTGDGSRDGSYDCYAQVLSPRELPPAYWFGDAIMYIGDPSGKGRSGNVSGNYAVCCTLHYINHIRTFDKLKRKRALTSKAAFAPVLLRARPEMADAIRDYDSIYDSVQNGAHLVEMTFEMVLFAPTKDRLLSLSQAIQQYFATLKFKLMVDRYAQREMFMNCLPFSVDRKFMFGIESRRFHTFTTEIALALLPLFGEWKGTGTPHVALISRTGQIMSVSLNDSNTNNNALIAAESGSGKSFYTNELLSMYMSEGARTWIIDIGRSYEKLCNILHGEFIAFDSHNLPCMNPFRMINSIDEEHDSVVAILESMISPKGTLSDTQEAVLVRIFDELWAEKQQEMTVDDVEAALRRYAEKNSDPRIADMSTQLYEYTSRGPYGNVFTGDNPITFKNRMTVLELEELAGYPNLRRVILLQLIFQIQQAVFLSPDRSQRKIVMIDEAWDLLKEGQTAKFMEGAYRKFRKYGASAIIATQAISDLYSSSGNSIGTAIANNSAFYFLLGQKASTVDQIKEHKYLSLSDGGYDLLKTVHTEKGVFSEIFITSNAGSGIGRLIVSDFERLMFSTDPQEIAAINKYVNMGATYSQAINQILADQGRLDPEAVKKHDRLPGRLMGQEEAREILAKKHEPTGAADVDKYENHMEWDPQARRLIADDGSNVRNPAYEGPVLAPDQSRREA